MALRVSSFVVLLTGAVVLLSLPPFRVVRAGGDEGGLSAAIENLHERPSTLYCSCNNIEGRELVFDLTVSNPTAAALDVYAFVWATNDEVNPPERGLWPLDAVDTCLTETGELKVEEPSDGKLVQVPAGNSVRVRENAILQPIGWFDGERVSFQSLWVQLWSREGELVFETVVDLGS